MKKILLLISLLCLTLNAKEINNQDYETLCNNELKKEKPNKSLMQQYCTKVAKDYEKQKNYGSASWYYLLGGDVRYNISTLNKYVKDKNSYVIGSNLGHSYALNNQYKKTKIMYIYFLNKNINPNKAIQDDFKILAKLYPNKLENIKKAKDIWDELYKPLKPIEGLYKKYEKAKNESSYKKALEYMTKIVKIEEKYIDIDSIALADGYNNIGFIYDNLGKYKKALEYYSKSLKISKRVLGEEYPNTATSYNNVGLVYGNLGNYKKALEYLNKSLIISKKILGKEHLDTATSYSNIGFAYGNLGEYKKALEYYIEALEIREKLLDKNHLDIANSYNNIGEAYGDLGGYKKALEYLNKSLKIREEKLGTNHVDTATSYNNIGGIYYVLGNYAKSLEYYNKDLTINKKILGKKHPSVATSYNNIGLVYARLGNYNRALEYYSKALATTKKQVNIATSYNNTGLIYNDLGNYEKALEYYDKSLKITEEISGKEHLDVAISYNNIGVAYSNLKNYKKALDYYKKSSKITENILGYKHISTAISYNNIGLVYNNLKNYKKALEYYYKSLKITKEILGKKHLSTAISYNNIGMYYGSIGKHKKALEYLSKSLKIQNAKQPSHMDTASTYYSISLAYKALNNHHDFYINAQKAFAIFQQNREKNFAFMNQKEKKLFLEKYIFFIDVLLESSSLHIEDLNKKKTRDNTKKIDNLKKYLFNSWINYKGSLLDSENTLAMLRQTTKDKKALALIEDLINAKRYYAKLSLNTPKTKEEIQTYPKRLTQQENKINTLESKLASHVAKFKQELNLRDITYKNIAKYLNKNELYIDYASTKDNYYIFTLDKDKNINFITLDKNTTKDINSYVKEFRKDIDKIISNPSIKIHSKNTLSKLNYLLLSSVLTKYKNYIISPDGALRVLPFEALFNQKTSKYLIEEKNIRYTPSGKEFLRIHRYNNNQPTKEVVIFTDPNYEADLTNNVSYLTTSNTNNSLITRSINNMSIFLRLTGFKEEENIIKSLFDKDYIKSYSRNRASENNMYKLINPNILHISTHGFFINDETITNPMLKSGIALSGANIGVRTQKDTGIVTSLKLSGLNLQGTNLVVLSACETGLVDLKDTDTISGLTKSFIQAGAKNLVISLWSVSDKYTTELMDKFYHNTKENMYYTKALQQAKIDMIKDDLHPFYWSAFIIVGK